MKKVQSSTKIDKDHFNYNEINIDEKIKKLEEQR